MGRNPRHDFAGAIHLVTNRGTAQTMLFRSAGDRRTFLALLSEIESRFGVCVVAFVLMGNHYHVIVHSTTGRLADAMHFLDGSFARIFNRRHQRQGALFQGRYDNRLIDDDEQLSRAGAYVHLNPVKAGFVTEAVMHRWSSLKSYATGRPLAPWLHLALPGAGPGYTLQLEGHLGSVLALDIEADDPAEHWWAPDREPSPPPDAVLHDIDAAIAGFFQVSIDEIYVPVRGRRNDARTVAIGLAVESGHSAASVADRYGLQPGGVHAAALRFRKLRDAEPELLAWIAAHQNLGDAA